MPAGWGMGFARAFLTSLFCFATSVAFLNCGSDKIGGSSGPGTGGSGQAGSTDAATTGAAGTSWTGYVENFQFPSGSDALALTFSTDAAGGVHGTIVFGKGTSPPPATDPSLGYPSDFSAFAQTNQNGLRDHAYVAEGYSYALDPGTLANSRLRFTVSLHQLWAGWCALQTNSDGPSFCGPNSGGGFDPTTNDCYLSDPATMKNVPIDCSKWWLCDGTGPCDCSGSGPCGVGPFGGSVTFDVSVRGTSASGSIAGSLDSHNVHFTKN
jgi:hypothetical protein